MQRLFNEYVGVGPKWVINRYRMHEAVARVQSGQPVAWAALAQDLRYFDQAHFITDFRKLVGLTPRCGVVRRRQVSARKKRAIPHSAAIQLFTNS